MASKDSSRFSSNRKAFEVADYVASSMQLAMLLELSAYPKPGNVHRTRDHEDMRYEHFLGTISGLHSTFFKAADYGWRTTYKGRVGKLVFEAAERMLHWQSDGNTTLGTIMLLTPLAVAAGRALRNGGLNSIEERLRREVVKVCEDANFQDSMWLFKAIKLVRPGGLGKVQELDVYDPSSLRRIREEKIPLSEIFHASAKYDSIASEWVTGFKVTFEVGYPYYMESLNRHKDLNVAAVNTFLKILSENPDTHIARKVGLNIALEVSRNARKILEKGGASTSSGMKLLWNLDKKLRSRGQELNPGTTADLTCSSIAVATLSGVRP